MAYPRSIALFENFKNFIKTKQTSPVANAETPIPSVAMNQGINDKTALFKEWLDDDEGDQLDDDFLLTGLQVFFVRPSD